MNSKITIGEKSGLETPVYINGVEVGLIVVNPTGRQFMPTARRVYIDSECLMGIAELLK